MTRPHGAILDAVDPTAPRVRCTATAKSTRRQCTRLAVQGSTVCRYHGGSAPQVQHAATRRLALGEAIAELDKLGRPHEIDPAAAMLEMVYEAAGNVAVLRRLVQQLQINKIDPGTGVLESDDEDHPVFMDDIDRSELGASIASRVDPANWKAAPHVWVTMYDAERERLVRWAKACRDAGVEERRVELAEEDGRRLVEVLLAVVDGLFGLLQGQVASTILERLRRDELPGLVRAAITATSTP